MAKLRVSVFLITLGIVNVNLVEPMVQQSLSKFLESLAGVKHVKIPELLNQLCNESQGSNIVLRDACYGCFFRATSLPLGYPLLMAMSNCADLYLNGTDYGHCQQYLAAKLRECVGEAIRMFPKFNTTDVQLAQLYVNTTACVLAKTRCSYMNPITGEFQEDDLANKLHIPTINAMLVNTDYDINIVQLPFHYSSIDVCAKQRNYEQASWPGVMC
ncbi:hypothetical protein WH47_01948 [Habropoda laboriosa]|uniref:Uncharacterized protein n=1 Tax=Habropoda laboriosa TaxID=597456 RepID=A0A0L7QXW3_9HYME|nr:hypothetical protein WH47_01948 [Habropoda laboriosa]